MTLNFSKNKNYSKWYNEIIEKSKLAEYSGVRGFMIIKPYGYSIWSRMKKTLNKILEKTGHLNCYFPLLIPKSYISKEYNHVKGFAKECAVVTHYRLKNKKGKISIDKTSKLKEELIIRPTSESIIWKTYKKWIKSYRDLPILINQWSNAVRWEMKIKLLLRTSEFLWQEGHTAHETKQEALLEIKKILNIYKNFLEQFVAIPVISGKKTLSEKFSGAKDTYCLEAITQNGKAIQLATSHFLGQNFSTAFDVKYQNKQGETKYPWGTSWGISSRILGALIMVHSDDKGLVLPPKIAPIQVVIIPIYKNKIEFKNITKNVKRIIKILQKINIRVEYDNREFCSPGQKFNEHEIKGIPIRVNIGYNEIKNQTIEIIRRDKLSTKIIIDQKNIKIIIPKIIQNIQLNIFAKATKLMKKYTTYVDNYCDFKKILNEKGGFIIANWDGNATTEKKIQKETKATIRCILDNIKNKNNKCVYSKLQSKKLVAFAKSY